MTLNIIPKFLDEALTPVGQEIGERLADIVNLIFTPIIKAKAVRDKNLEIFLQELSKDVSNIPEKYLQDPPLYIVGPALDDVGKFYHDEEYLRKIFSKLISSSMDQRCIVHPSYIKVIEQLSYDDAKFINDLIVIAKATNDVNYKDYISKEIIMNCYTLNNSWYESTACWLYLEKQFVSKFDLNKNISGLKHTLINLQRLGIIYITQYDRHDIYNSIPKLDREFLIENFNCIKTYSIRMTKYGLYFANSCCRLE